MMQKLMKRQQHNTMLMNAEKIGRGRAPSSSSLSLFERL